MPTRCPRHAACITVFSATLFTLACTSAPESRSDLSPSARTLFSESPPAWYNAYFTDLEVAADGEQAWFDGRRLVDLRTGTEIPLPGQIDVVFSATFDHRGNLRVRGRRGAEQGWFHIDPSTGEARLVESPPADAAVAYSPDGERIASWSDNDPKKVHVEDQAHEFPGAVVTVTWLPHGEGVLVLVQAEHGLRRLCALDRATGEIRTVADRLDGKWRGANVAVSDDGRRAFLALASPAAPDPRVRHEPYADRDLDIYEIDLASGSRRPVVQTSAEELAPAFANGVLHWVSIETRMEVVLVPIDGGEARVVAEGVQGPSWRPDSLALGVTTGNWRLADWALNLDGGVIEIDADGRTASPVMPIITGYHEDFSPVWSPDGTWIAYHSHRSAGPVAGYRSEGSSDDIYVRRPESPTNAEIRLTDFGIEVGTPVWAPDGRRLLVDSRDENGGASAWIVEMDPQSGAFVNRARIPPPTSTRGQPSWGAWSPVRDEIAIVWNVRDGPAELWILAPDGSDARRAATFAGPWFGGLDFSADGETLVYGGRVGDRVQLFSVPRMGGEPSQLTHDSANLLHPQVSPDGEWIAATRILHDRRILRQPD